MMVRNLKYFGMDMPSGNCENQSECGVSNEIGNLVIFCIAMLGRGSANKEVGKRTFLRENATKKFKCTPPSMNC